MPIWIEKIMNSMNVFFCDTCPWSLSVGLVFHSYPSRNFFLCQWDTCIFVSVCSPHCARSLLKISAGLMPFVRKKFDYDALHNGLTYLLLSHCVTDEIWDLRHESGRGADFRHAHHYLLKATQCPVHSLSYWTIILVHIWSTLVNRLHYCDTTSNCKW